MGRKSSGDAVDMDVVVSSHSATVEQRNNVAENVGPSDRLMTFGNNAVVIDRAQGSPHETDSQSLDAIGVTGIVAKDEGSECSGLTYSCAGGCDVGHERPFVGAPILGPRTRVNAQGVGGRRANAPLVPTCGIEPELAPSLQKPDLPMPEHCARRPTTPARWRPSASAGYPRWTG